MSSFSMAGSLKSDTVGVFQPHYQQNQRIGPLLTALELLSLSLNGLCCFSTLT